MAKSKKESIPTPARVLKIIRKRGPMRTVDIQQIFRPTGRRLRGKDRTCRMVSNVLIELVDDGLVLATNAPARCGKLSIYWNSI